MRRIALALATAALALNLGACATYVEHRFSGDPQAALAVERLIDRTIKVECPSGVSVREAQARTRYTVDTDRARQPERSEINGRTVRACAQ